MRRRYMHGRRRRRSPLKVDLTRKSGLGPREWGEDEQRKTAAVNRFEMGETNVDPRNDMESEDFRRDLYKKTEKTRQ